MRVVNKRFMLILCSIVLIVALFGFVIAYTVVINNPVASGNYTTSMNFTVTTAISEPVNMTIYYNSSGGAAGTDASLLLTIVNTTDGQTIFANASVDVSSLNDSAVYNFSVYVSNLTEQNYSLSIANITIDNTVPNVTLLSIPVSSGEYKDSIVLNVSANDVLMGMSNVFFNVTNSTGSQNATYTASNDAGIYWNATLDTSDFIDGTYNITVWANDSVNNLNNSIIASGVIFDNTDPVVVLTSSSSTTTSLTLTIGITDAGSTSCTSSRSGASISGTTLTESSLSCGTSYSYVVTCTDGVGNSGASSSTSFTTSTCGGGGVSSSDGFSKTYSVSYSDILSGTSRLLKESERAKFVFSGASHYVGIKSISSDIVSIEIASFPVQHDYSLGDERKFDLDEDGTYDLLIRLDSISGSTATIFMKIISEEVPEGESGFGGDVIDDITSVDDVGGVDGGEDVADELEGDGKAWIWGTVLAIVIIVAVVYFVVTSKKKKK